MGSELFSERLKSALILRNMKQSELCSRTGITKSSMSQYISGKFIPKREKLTLLATALDVFDIWLLGRDVPFNKDEFYDDNSDYNKKKQEEERLYCEQSALENYQTYLNLFSTNDKIYKSNIKDLYVDSKQYDYSATNIMGMFLLFNKIIDYQQYNTITFDVAIKHIRLLYASNNENKELIQELIKILSQLDSFDSL